MGTITLSVPDDLKAQMDKTDWINWSSVARHAFAETLKDFKEMQLKRKLAEVSEITDTDSRQVRDSVAKEAVRSIEAASRNLKQGKIRPLSVDELDKMMGLK